jgi:hypothetical protein
MASVLLSVSILLGLLLLWTGIERILLRIRLETADLCPEPNTRNAGCAHCRLEAACTQRPQS